MELIGVIFRSRPAGRLVLLREAHPPLHGFGGCGNDANRGRLGLIRKLNLFAIDLGVLDLKSLRQMNRQHIRIAAEDSALAGQDFLAGFPAFVLKTDPAAGQVARGRTDSLRFTWLGMAVGSPLNFPR